MKDEDGPWVALTSKAHPDEVYYFNVLTGVSTWEKPKNFCESSDTLVSTDEKSQNSGYIVESLSPKSSPKPQDHQNDNDHVSENNEKKKERLFKGGNSLYIPKKKHFVREYPYRIDRTIESRNHLGSHLSKCEEGVEKNHAPKLSLNPPFQERRMDHKLPSNNNTDLTNQRNFSQSTKQPPFGRTELKSQPAPATRSVIYGSASLRLEKLKNKLTEERLKGSKYQGSQTGWHGSIVERERNSLSFKERPSTSLSANRYHQHPYIPYASSSRRDTESSSYTIDGPKSVGNAAHSISTLNPSVYPRKEVQVASNTSQYFKKPNTDEFFSKVSGRNQLLPKSDEFSVLRSEASKPVLSKIPDFQFKKIWYVEEYRKDKFNENKLDFVKTNSNAVSSTQSKSFAQDRLKRLQGQLQNKFTTAAHSKEANKCYSNNKSWEGNNYSQSFNQRARISSSYPVPSKSENKASPMVASKNTWDWNSQYLVRDYNHKRIGELNELPVTPKLKYHGPLESFSPTKNSVGISGSSVQGLRNKNYDHSSGPLVNNNNNRQFDWSKPKPRIEQPSANQTYKLRAGLNSRPDVTNSPVNNSSRVSYSQPLIKNPSCEFVEPNQETLAKLHQSVSKKKGQESKGGITKINRRVQKQIRTVAPKLGERPASIVNKILTSGISQGTSLNAGSPPLPKKHDIEEMMDWEPIEPEKVVLHVEELRKEGKIQSSENSVLTKLCKLEIPISSKWFIVIDTNVLLSHLEFVEHLRDVNDHEFGMPTLFIPWIVLQELDGLKSTVRNPSLMHYARKAVRFLQENLECKHPRVRGQPKSSLGRLRPQKPDDCILQCALDLQENSNKVLLLTNDRNLFNKATVSGIDCCSAARLHEDLESRRNSPPAESTSCGVKSTTGEEQDEKINVIVCQIKECVRTVLEEVLKTEMILAYDRSWLLVITRKPPWTINDVLYCILKHWIAVFGLILPSAVKELLEKILALFQKSYNHSFSDVDNLLNACMSLMSVLLPLSYKEQAENALYKLQELKRSLEQLSSTSNEERSLTASQSADKFCRSSISNDGSTSDSDSRTTISNVSSKGTRKKSHSSSASHSDGDCGVKTAANANESDEDCISLVASSFCDNLLNKQLSESSIKEGQETIHNHLNKIWEKVAVFCGMLCDLMGIERCVPYEPPNPFPTKEMLHQNMLYFVKCVSSLLRSVERILSYPSGELFENHPAVLNFCSFIRESFPALTPQESKLLPRYVYIYCTRSDTRQQLEVGKKQFEQFETVLNDAVSFFMNQNLSGPSTIQLL